MKHTLITALLLVAISTAHAQQKHLPKKVTITLTDAQILKLDSAVQAGSLWTDSKRNTQWFLSAFAPLYQQVNEKLVVDSVKKKK